MSDPTPEERAQGAYEAACLRREALGKDMIRSPGPAQTQRIFVTEIAHAIRAAEASALRRAAEWVDVDPQRPAPGIADWLREQADRVESDSR